MRSTVATLVVLAASLGACGDRASAPAGPAAQAPDSAANPSRPWDVRSESGLWRVQTAGDGPRLLCHGGGSLIPDEGAGCSAAVDRPSADGFTRERRCAAGPVRTIVAGDLASGFSLTRTGADGAQTVATYLRLGACPDGWRAGESRADGLQDAPRTPPPAPPAAAPRPSRPAGTDAINDALDGTYDGPSPVTPAEPVPSVEPAPVEPAPVPEPPAG